MSTETEYTVTQVRELQQIVERNLLAEFQKFEKRTGCKIERVELQRVSRFDGASSLHLVNLRLEL